MGRTGSGGSGQASGGGFGITASSLNSGNYSHHHPVGPGFLGGSPPKTTTLMSTNTIMTGGGGGVGGAMPADSTVLRGAQLVRAQILAQQQQTQANAGLHYPSTPKRSTASSSGVQLYNQQQGGSSGRRRRGRNHQLHYQHHQYQARNRHQPTYHTFLASEDEEDVDEEYDYDYNDEDEDYEEEAVEEEVDDRMEMLEYIHEKHANGDAMIMYDTDGYGAEQEQNHHRRQQRHQQYHYQQQQVENQEVVLEENRGRRRKGKERRRAGGGAASSSAKSGYHHHHHHNYNVGGNGRGEGWRRQSAQDNLIVEEGEEEEEYHGDDGVYDPEEEEFERRQDNDLREGNDDVFDDANLAAGVEVEDGGKGTSPSATLRRGKQRQQQYYHHHHVVGAGEHSSISPPLFMSTKTSTIEVSPLYDVKYDGGGIARSLFGGDGGAAVTATAAMTSSGSASNVENADAINVPKNEVKRKSKVKSPTPSTPTKGRTVLGKGGGGDGAEGSTLPPTTPTGGSTKKKRSNALGMLLLSSASRGPLEKNDPKSPKRPAAASEHVSSSRNSGSGSGNANRATVKSPSYRKGSHQYNDQGEKPRSRRKQISPMNDRRHQEQQLQRQEQEQATAESVVLPKKSLFLKAAPPSLSLSSPAKKKSLLKPPSSPSSSLSPRKKKSLLASKKGATGIKVKVKGKGKAGAKDKIRTTVFMSEPNNSAVNVVADSHTPVPATKSKDSSCNEKSSAVPPDAASSAGLSGDDAEAVAAPPTPPLPPTVSAVPSKRITNTRDTRKSTMTKPTSFYERRDTLMQNEAYRHAQSAGLLWQTLMGEFVRFPPSWYDDGHGTGDDHRDEDHHFQRSNKKIVPQRRRVPPMSSPEFDLASRWSYISRNRVRGNAYLNRLVKRTSSRARGGGRGRLLLHLVVQDAFSWGATEDVVIGCFHPRHVEMAALKEEKRERSKDKDKDKERDKMGTGSAASSSPTTEESSPTLSTDDDVREIWMAVRKRMPRPPPPPPPTPPPQTAGAAETTVLHGGSGGGEGAGGSSSGGLGVATDSSTGGGVEVIGATTVGGGSSSGGSGSGGTAVVVGGGNHSGGGNFVSYSSSGFFADVARSLSTVGSGLVDSVLLPHHMGKTLEDVAGQSPLGEKKKCNNSNVCAIFGDKPPIETVFVIESHLYDIMCNAKETSTAGTSSPAILLLQEFLFKRVGDVT